MTTCGRVLESHSHRTAFVNVHLTLSKQETFAVLNTEIWGNVLFVILITFLNTICFIFRWHACLQIVLISLSIFLCGKIKMRRCHVTLIVVLICVVCDFYILGVL